MRRFLLKYPLVNRSHEAVMFSDGTIALRLGTHDAVRGMVLAYGSLREFQRCFSTGVIEWIDQESPEMEENHGHIRT